MVGCEHMCSPRQRGEQNKRFLNIQNTHEHWVTTTGHLVKRPYMNFSAYLFGTIKTLSSRKIIFKRSFFDFRQSGTEGTGIQQSSKAREHNR